MADTQHGRASTVAPGLRLVVFDGDDTLWDTAALYSAAKAAFVAALGSEGIDPTRALRVLETTDFRNVERLGFSADRFPTSMTDAYRALSAECGRAPGDLAVQKVRQIGSAVFEHHPRTDAAARAVLAGLSRRYKLVLCTKGDRRVQEARIAASGLAKHFCRIYIPPTKGEREFREILDDTGVASQSAISIGDSVRSDINPALSLGMYAIWIEKRSWAHERAEPLASGRLFRAAGLDELTSLIQTIEALALGGAHE